MKKNLVLLSLLVMSVLMVSAVSAVTISYGTIGTGATATQIGDAVELYTPAGGVGSGYVRLKIPGGIALNAITSLSYTAKVTNPGTGSFAPEVVLNIDADGADELEGTGINWMLSSYNPSTLNGDNFLSGDNWPTSAGSADPLFVNRDALSGYYYWSANDARTGFGSFWNPFTTIVPGMLPVHGIDSTDKVYSIDFVVGTSGNFNNMRALFSSVELNGVEYKIIPPCEITIDDPEYGEYYNDNIHISWSTENCLSSAYDLYYREGSCALTPPLSWHTIKSGVNDDAYSWASGFDKGEYCIKIEEAGSGSGGIAAMDDTFYIDNLDPVADLSAGEPYTCNEGDSITLNASGSTDNYGIASYKWDLDDDGQYDDATGVTTSYKCLDGDATETVSVKVTDYADNEDTADATVEISNVAPTCTGIAGPTDAAVGQPVIFTGSATDPAGSYDTLTYDWDFDDGNTADDENPTTHTYATDDDYTVTLTVSDEDGGSNTCTHDLDVVAPKVLNNQEVIAFHRLVNDFGSDVGSAYNSFATDLPNDTDECLIVVAPSNVKTRERNEDSCQVGWSRGIPGSANPTNDEQGTHYVLIRAEDDSDNYDYYTFDITVYSWIIELEKGWNLISLPLVPEDKSAGNVLAGIVGNLDSVWSYEYNAATGTSTWKCFDGGIHCNGYGALNSIEPGRGYWVKMDADGEKLKGFGKKTDQTSTYPGNLPEVDVPTNHWMLIGRYGILGTSSDNEFGDLPLFGPNNALASLQSDPFFATQVLDGTSSSVTSLSPQDGYWAWIKNYNVQSQTYAPIDGRYSLN